jgi:protocatechuate 3,4-dioxygenase beta subunit
MGDAGLRRRLDEAERCRIWPEQELGPYHLEGQPFREDVVEDRVGVPLRLGIRLLTSDGVSPERGAEVEIWQCDAFGRYSGFPPPPGPATNAAPAAPPQEVGPQRGFLRGRQRTDDSGTCIFRTIYPGWYPGRAVHIHLAARAGGETFVSQLYFPEDVTDAVFSRAPYCERPGRDTTNATDSIYTGAGEAALLDSNPEDDGYQAAVCFVLPQPEPVSV